MIIPYNDAEHRASVVEFWTEVFGYETAHNDPALALDRKVAAEDGLFWVALEDGALGGTIMAGYDGHRGWLYSLAVRASARDAGLGSALVDHAEGELRERGCLKINLQIVEGNDGVESFYHKLGYVTEKRISMGKTLYQHDED